MGDSRQAIDGHGLGKFKVLGEHIWPIGQKLPVHNPKPNRRKCLAHLIATNFIHSQVRPAVFGGIGLA